MQYATKEVMQQLINELRALAPKRPLSYGESLQVARLQAVKLRQWAKASEPAINLLWLRNQRAVPVHFVPRYRLGDDNSGLTTDEIDGGLRMFVNENEPRERQRFTLAHEFKHVLDFQDASVLHANLGYGETKVQRFQIELIANEFAGNLLMPTALVKRAWFKTQDISLCAALFDVSGDAMRKRLLKLGLIAEPKPKPRVYFRHSGAIQPIDLKLSPVAA